MSSRKYETELSADPALRAVVVASLLAAFGTGIWVIVSLPVDSLQKQLAATGWFLMNARQWRDMTKAHKRWRRIRICCDGSAALLDSKGDWHPATLTKNCVVLSKVAWMNLSVANADSCCELLRGSSTESEQWRRLQVIWRHMGSGS